MSLRDTKPVIGIIVQARMGSTRLPGKVLLKLVDDESVLSYLLRRLLRCRRADKIIVATTTNPKDDVLEDFLKARGCLYYRGSEEDCLDRFYQASSFFGIDVIVRITSDCPLVIPEVIDEMIEYYLKSQMEIDYLSNRQYTNYPEGVDVEIFKRNMLEEAAIDVLQQQEREHINYYFLNRDSNFRIRYYNHNLGYDYSRFRLSIDSQNDIDRICGLFRDKGLPLDFSLEQLVQALTQ